MSLYCHYGALCRVPCPDAAIRAGQGSIGDLKHALEVENQLQKPVMWLSNHVNEDLLVAFSTQFMHLFARKIKNLGCSCHSTAKQPTNDLLGHGYHCPHLSFYEDYWQFATIPFTEIRQVLMTYRTTSSASSSSSTTGFAARTKDLLLKFSDDKLLWLEFEHNLARGAFLNALTTASASATLDVDYIDLNDYGELASTIDLAVFPPIPFLQTLERPDDETRTSSFAKLRALLLPDGEEEEQNARFQFLRDALRHVMYEKIKLALQLSQEAPSSGNSTVESDPSCHFLLFTAMEMANVLDEPDLYAFTWLTSGFINFQQQELVNKTKQKLKDLAFNQVHYSLEICMENSLTYLRFLAHQCLSDIHLWRGNPSNAIESLQEATKFLPVDAEATLQSDLEQKLKELREVQEQLGPLNAPSGRKASTANGSDRPRSSSLSDLFSTCESDAKKKEKTSETNQEEGAVSMSSLMLAKMTKERLSIKKSKSAFNLWAHSFGQQPHTTTKMLLCTTPRQFLITSKVYKHALHGVKVKTSEAGLRMRSGSLQIELMDRNGQRKSRLRVFYDGNETFKWLQDHLKTRLTEAIDVFYEPTTRQPIDFDVKIGDFVEKDHQVLYGRIQLPEAPPSPSKPPVPPLRTVSLGNSSPLKAMEPSPTKRTIAMLAQSTALVTCAHCNGKIRVDDVDLHAETCH